MVKMKIVFLCILTSISFTQNKIQVYTSIDKVTMSKIEIEILKNVFQLYNKSNNTNLEFEVNIFKTFGKMLSAFELNTKKNKHTLLAMNRITITEERKKNVDFSIRYVPGKLVFITKKKGSNQIVLNKNKTVVYVENTVHEIVAKKLNKKYGIRIYPVKTSIDLYQELIDNKYDYGISENVSIWEKEEFKIIEEIEFQEGEGYGIMYPKGSKLKKMFDKYLLYFMKSTKFKKLLSEYYGEDVKQYFIKSMLTL